MASLGSLDTTAATSMALNLSRPGQLFRIFPARLALSMLLFELARKLFSPCTRPTYAQTGEDIILASYLDLSRPGTYVDVGCHHPLKGSNTFLLYSRGWKGLAIDGNEELIRLFRRLRPRDTALHAVVSNLAEDVTFTIAKAAELSTISANFEKEWIGDQGVEKRVALRSVTLGQLFEQHKVPYSFELLSIDVEGHDYEVLTSFDLSSYRPRAILVEMHGFLQSAPESNKVFAYLASNGYRLVSYSVMNGLFMDSSQTG